MGTTVFLLHHYTCRWWQSCEQPFMEIIGRSLQIRGRRNRNFLAMQAQRIKDDSKISSCSAAELITGNVYDSNSPKSGSLCFKSKSALYYFAQYSGVYS